MSRTCCLTVGIFAVSLLARAQEPSALVVPLWPKGAPGSEGKTAPEKVENGRVTSVHQPSLTVYLPPKEKATGAGVVVIPGGGHRMLAIDHEGYAVASWLRDRGIAGFVLKYRLAREEGSTYTIVDHALRDTQRALRLVRSRAAEWGVDPVRVGVVGFSAGGELAQLVSQRPADGTADAEDAVERQNARPAFQALIYPGRSQDIVPMPDSPPVFLACGYKDRPDISEGLANVYLAFKKAGVPAELHVYAGAGHGFGIRETDKTPAASWPDRFREWLVDRGFVAS
jgi:endo-1,4-beta-xylanase